MQNAEYRCGQEFGMTHERPRWLTVSADEPEAAVLQEAARLLAADEVVAYPTDTFYGLAADPRSPAAVERLFALKGRDASRAIPLIAADWAQVETLCGAPGPLASRLGHAFWPGPLTLVLPLAAALAPELVAGGTTVAVRVPDNAVSRGLAAALGMPVTSTSANRSGAAPAQHAAAAAAVFGAALGAVLDAGPARGGLASTIVDLTGDEPRLLRAGAVPWERVLQFLPK
jgi:L-threonylcarbamoyladenylate synthase